MAAEYTADLPKALIEDIVSLLHFHVRSSRDLEKELHADEKVYLGLACPAAAHQPLAGHDPEMVRDLPDPETQIAGDLRADNNIFYGVADSQASQLMPGEPSVVIRANKSELVARAEARTKYVNLVFGEQDMYSTMKKAGLQTFMHGLSYLYTRWDTRTQSPSIEVVRHDDLWVDPLARRWRDVRYVIHRREVPLAEVQANARAYHKATAAKLSGTRNLHPRPGQPTESPYLVVTLYEVWYFAANKLVLLAYPGDAPSGPNTGTPLILAASSLPYRGAARVPFEPMSFNYDLYTYRGMSDAKLARPAARQLDILSRLDVAFKRVNIPVPIINESLVSDVDEFQDAFNQPPSPNKVIRIKLPPNARVEDVIGHTPVPTLPANFDGTIRRVQEVLEFVLAMPSYLRGATNNGTVATEFVLADKALSARNEQRFKARNRVVAETAKKVLALAEQFMSADQVIPIGISNDTGDFREVMIDRRSLGFPDKGTRDDSRFYAYDVQVFDRSETNPTTVLRGLAQVLTFMVNNPNVDQRLLIKIIGEAVGEPRLLLSMDKVVQPPALDGAPGGLPAAAQASGGTAPPGLDVASLDPAIQAAFVGGQTMAGIPTGAESGAA